jgi:hypothetical protein
MRGSYPIVGPLFLSRFAGQTPEPNEASTPKVRLTYCDLSQKHILAEGSREEEVLFWAIVKNVLRPREGSQVVISCVSHEDR